MSQYAEFFIRNKDDFLPLFSYSRSSFIYQIYSKYIPYEKVKSLNKFILSNAKEDIENIIKTAEDRIKELNETKSSIKDFNNSISEKIETLENINSDINEQKEELDEYKYALSFTIFLENIIQNVTYEKEYDENNYIYAGIEIGNPTIEDVIETSS